MSCNCNTANPKCEPCAICTPPGVTGLTTCEPLDPCEERYDITCGKWSGQDNPCINIYSGDDLLKVLINILNVYFPQSYCCGLAGYLNNNNCLLSGTAVTPTPPTTTTTSTTTSSTTTTTTLPPNCIYLQIVNNNPNGISVIQYTDCCQVQQQAIVRTNIQICAFYNTPVQTISGAIAVNDLGDCNQFCPPVNTTTTTIPCECGVYDVINTTGQDYTLNYIECQNQNFINSQLLIPGNTTVVICACSDIESQTFPQGISVVPKGIQCDNANFTTSTTSTTSTTTSTSTTSTSSTTTTTTAGPCTCYTIENPTDELINYQYQDCGAMNVSFGVVAPFSIGYRCAELNSVFGPVAAIITNIGACGTVLCNLPTTTTSTSTTTSSTTTTTTTLNPLIECTTNGQINIYNESGSATIVSGNSSSWYVLTTGFPILAANSDSGVQTGTTDPVTFTIDNVGGTSGCIYMYLNSNPTPVASAPYINTNGQLITLTPTVTINTDDCVVIIVGEC